jgi:GrpB-like predicted nucleotidyltransferase (UPF0157 family)
MTDDLNKLTTEELGLLFPIIIVDYDPEWHKLYILEKRNILKAVGTGHILRIEHIGSTAVPGLCAKPTIDMLIEISGVTNCDTLIKDLENIHYQHIPKPESPPPHCMFAKGYSGSGITGQTYHLHLRYRGDHDELVFRDYLINNPDTAYEYSDLKRRLTEEFKNDREKYTAAKSDFICRIVAKARTYGTR